MSDDAFAAWQQRAKDADVLDVATRICGARLKGRGRERTGPCPRCGGEDRFSVNTQKQLFNCRGAAGGNVVDMVMHCHAVPYVAACELITGELPPAHGSQLTPEERAKADRALAKSKAAAARREAEDNQYRKRAQVNALDDYDRAVPLAGSSAAVYLARRGLTFPPTPQGKADRLKCIEDMRFVVQRENDAGGRKVFETLHTGPAMVAPIVNAERKPRGLHITYIDLDDPKGKLKLTDPKTGDELKTKKSRGSMAGNHVELIGPREPKRLVLGEGIEKVVAVWMALQATEKRDELANIDQLVIEHTAFWSACNLGNLAGPHAGTLPHPTLRSDKGRAMRVASAEPDFNRPAIEIPDSVTDLVLLGDSTSEPFATQLAMCRAAARYAKKGRTVCVAWAPQGKDFDDLWFEAGDDVALRAAAAATVAKIVSHAKPPAMPTLAAAPARVSAPKGAGNVVQLGITGGRGAAAPSDPLPSDPDGHSGDPPEDPANEALGPAPPAAAPPARLVSSEKSQPSRKGRSGHRSADRGKWGGGDQDLDGEELDRALAYYPRTDLGNAERMTQRFRRHLKWSPSHGWFRWAETHWSVEGADAELLIAEHRTARGIQDEAAAIEKLAEGLAELPKPKAAVASEDGKVVDLAAVKASKKAAREAAKKTKERRAGLVGLAAALREHGRDSEQAARLSAIGKRAKGYLDVKPSDLDVDPFAINVANGTLIVRRDWSAEAPPPEGWRVINEFIRFKPHDPGDLITKRAPVDFDQAAISPIYDAFLEFVQPSEENRRHLHQCGGMCLTGDISEQVMWFNWGKGKNGKSTLFNAWAYVIGDYGRSVAIETFLSANMARSGAGPSPDIARLEGIRFARTSEPERGAKLAEALIKLATGGEPVTTRHLNKEFFELVPRFKLVMSGNYRPEVRGTDEGIWRRIRLIPWTVAIPAERRDRDFGDKLKVEASGILNRLLEGLCDWLRHGLNAPREIEQATAEYRLDSDPLGRFLDACVVTKAGARVQSSVLHQLFCAWCRANGEKEWTATGLGRALAERGFHRRHSDVNYWLDIEATKTVSDFTDQNNEPPPHGESVTSDDANSRAGPEEEGF